jgi:hypothetical protein
MSPLSTRVIREFPVEKRRITTLTSLTFLFLVLCNSFHWPNVNAWGLGNKDFPDLEATLSFVNCFEDFGLKIYSVPDPMECSNYVYGIPLVATARIFGIHQISISILGHIFLAMLAFVFAYFLSISKIRLRSAVVAMVFLVLTPPISLLAQRGNIDILIAFLILVGIKASQNGLRPIGFFLIATTALIKFYTLPLLLVLLLQKQFRKPVYISSGLIVLFGVVANFSLIRTLPSNGNYGAFGNRGIYFYLQDAQLFSIDTPRILGDLVGLVLLMSVIFTLALVDFRFKRVFKGLKVDGDIDVQNAFLIVGITCYLFGMNYDYRLIYLILPMLVFKERNLFSDKILKYFLILTVAWTSFNASLFVQLVGDIVIGSLTGLYLFFFLRRLKVVFGSRE